MYTIYPTVVIIVHTVDLRLCVLNACLDTAVVARTSENTIHERYRKSRFFWISVFNRVKTDRVVCFSGPFINRNTLNRLSSEMRPMVSANKRLERKIVHTYVVFFHRTTNSAASSVIRKPCTRPRCRAHKHDNKKQKQKKRFGGKSFPDLTHGRPRFCLHCDGTWRVAERIPGCRIRFERKARPAHGNYLRTVTTTHASPPLDLKNSTHVRETDKIGKQFTSTPVCVRVYHVSTVCRKYWSQTYVWFKT